MIDRNLKIEGKLVKLGKSRAVMVVKNHFGALLSA